MPDLTGFFRLDGHLDNTGAQEEEVWGGVAYALASFMILMVSNELAV